MVNQRLNDDKNRDLQDLQDPEDHLPPDTLRLYTVWRDTSHDVKLVPFPWLGLYFWRGQKVHKEIIKTELDNKISKIIDKGESVKIHIQEEEVMKIKRQRNLKFQKN